MPTNLKQLITYSKNLKVLFVEDNKEVREQLLKLLENFFSNIDIAEDGHIAYNKYLELKEKENLYYDIIITDLSMPRMDGVELSGNITKINPFQVIVVISAHTESEKLLKLIEIGVYKFLRKPVDYNDLLTHFSSIISKIKREQLFTDIEKKLNYLEKENELLNDLVIKDKLTAIYNRRYLDNLLIKKFETFKNSKEFLDDFIIIFIDIDDFKIINDDYGHLIGDEVLIEFANILETNIRNVDTVGRWGGEEFIVVLERSNKDHAMEIAENLRKNIEIHSFKKVGNLTASFGISAYKQNDSISSLIQRADYSLYKAKDEGKNQIRFI